MKAYQYVLAARVYLMASSLLSQASVAKADNPVVQTIYTADPAPMVHDGRVYLFTGHDEDNSTYYDMRDWRLFSTNDMVNWQHHESPMDLTAFSWAYQSAWAGQVIARNNRFYFYVPIHRTNGGMSIGVGVSDKIEGPYVDAIGGPLVENGEIDPTVWIDKDGQAYMYWGNPNLWYIKLNEDMISYSGEMTKTNLTVEGFGARPDSSELPTMYQEGPWLSERNGIYYMLYAAKCCPEDIRYSTGPSATGPWTYGGLIMESGGGSFTNHVGTIDYEGTSYMFYHTGGLPGGGGFTRSVAVESFAYNADGTIPLIPMTTDGPQQIRSVDPYVRQEAELIAWSEGVETEVCSEGGIDVAYINNGDYIKVKGVAFGDGAASFTASVASATNGGNIEIRLDSKDGLLVGTCAATPTEGWQSWKTVECAVDGAEGTHDVFFTFTGEGDGFLFNFDWWKFGK